MDGRAGRAAMADCAGCGTRFNGESEFELRVGEDEASFGGVVVGGGVDGEGGRAELLHDIAAGDGAGAVEVDVFVVGTDGFLGCGGEDGLRESVAPAEACGEMHAADPAGVLVLGPSRAVEVASCDALDGDDAAAACDHDSALESGGLIVGDGWGAEADEGFRVGGEEVGGCEVSILDEAEPAERDFGEESALADDGCGHDDVEGRDSVGGDDEDSRGVVRGVWGEVVEVAHLSFAAVLEREVCSEERKHAGQDSGESRGGWGVCGRAVFRDNAGSRRVREVRAGAVISRVRDDSIRRP